MSVVEEFATAAGGSGTRQPMSATLSRIHYSSAMGRKCELAAMIAGTEGGIAMATKDTKPFEIGQRAYVVAARDFHGETTILGVAGDSDCLECDYQHSHISFYRWRFCSSSIGHIFGDSRLCVLCDQVIPSAADYENRR